MRYRKAGTIWSGGVFWLAVIVLVPLSLGLWTTSAQGIPAFARKYKTSCQTCHVAYPKLNAYGQAFRLLGYQLPQETEEQIKQPDVELGAESYKRVWPDAVWPGAIPAQVPISLLAEFLVRNSRRLEEEGGGIVKEKIENDFVFPSEVELIVGGTAGDHVAYFAEIGIEQEPAHEGFETSISIAHWDFRFTRLIKGSPALNLKIGSFQPEMVATFDHARRITLANYDAMFGVQTVHPGGGKSVGGGGHHGGGGAISLPAVARGFEAYGILANRFAWSGGVVNGIEPGHESFDGNDAKDVFGRVGYKFGGMALDGSNATTYTESSKNWRERSASLGVFAYRGDGSNIHFEEVENDTTVIEFQDDNFTRFGVDVNLIFDDLNIFGAWVRGKDDIIVEDEPDESGEFEYDAFFVEADAVLRYPWLHGAARYELVSFPHENTEDWKRGTFSITTLIRANVKAILEYTQDLNESDNREFLVGGTIAF
jgi:hypothetical protein